MHGSIYQNLPGHACLCTQKQRGAFYLCEHNAINQIMILLKLIFLPQKLIFTYVYFTQLPLENRRHSFNQTLLHFSKQNGVKVICVYCISLPVQQRCSYLQWYSLSSKWVVGQCIGFLCNATKVLQAAVSVKKELRKTEKSEVQNWDNSFIAF